jgi:ABC-2 type transport system permease protein
MSGLMAFLKKELTEQWRTHRLIIVSAVFLFFGLSTPLMTKYLPEIIKMAGQGLTIEIPPPTALQALAEYTSTMAQFGVLIAVLVAMGAVARERETGTAGIVLSKPVSYLAFILAKLKAISVSFLVAIILGGLGAWGYTLLLFGSAPVAGFVGQSLLLLLYMVLTVAVTLMFSSMFKSQLAAGALWLVVVIVLSLLSALPWVGPYMPGALTNWGNSLLTSTPGGSAWGALAVTFGLIFLSVYLAWASLRSQEL